MFWTLILPKIQSTNLVAGQIETDKNTELIEITMQFTDKREDSQPLGQLTRTLDSAGPISNTQTKLATVRNKIKAKYAMNFL